MTKEIIMKFSDGYCLVLNDKGETNLRENDITELIEELKSEISGMELAIEKFLNNVLECTTFISERDFNVTTL